MTINTRTLWPILLGPCLAAAVYAYLHFFSSLAAPAITVAAITMLCATWWVLEPIPIPATSLIPLALLPLLGVLDGVQVAEAYGHPLILLLMGGFILSTAMELSGTHRHVALMMVNLFGRNSARRVVLGFMAASALLSMWISNTATTLMLLPVALAVISGTNQKALVVPLLLGICYGASIGGMGTPIGTPPNLIFMRVYEDATSQTISFLQWMQWCVPIVIILVIACGFWLTRNLDQQGEFYIPPSGDWTNEQKRVMLVFSITALTWITRTEPFGGWRVWFDLPNANDASVALIAVVAMFIIPNGKGGKLLNWEAAQKIPWGMLILFAGGIALAKGFSESGLADHLAKYLQHLTNLPSLLMLLLICLAVTFLTEVTSNTASTSLLMPVLASAALAAHIDPKLMMIPAALSASCAFMLPVATAPNAIIFGSGKIPIQQMVRTGLALNFIAAGIIALMLWHLAE